LHTGNKKAHYSNPGCLGSLAGLLTSDYPVSYRIKRIVNEAPNVKTFYLPVQLEFSPGKFVMLWVPGFDEKPFALTVCNKREVAITVKGRGPFTKKLFSLKEGALLGLRGPYGHGFSLEGVKRACIVAGGVGIAAVVLLAEELARRKARVDFVHGCKSKEDVLFKKRLFRIARLHIATEDGSCGEKGYCTGILERLLKKKKYDMLYCCGPEVMMKFVLQLCNKYNVPAEFAVERYMKCGQGVCGQCSLDEFLCCTDGPVFSREKLNKSKEFGKVCYEKTGKKSKLGV